MDLAFADSFFRHAEKKRPRSRFIYMDPDNADQLQDGQPRHSIQEVSRWMILRDQNRAAAAVARAIRLIACQHVNEDDHERNAEIQAK